MKTKTKENLLLKFFGTPEAAKKTMIITLIVVSVIAVASWASVIIIAAV